MNIMHYSNLSQHLDYDRFVYLRSTDIEQKNYERLLWSVPDEWFYLLSLGHKIVVHDKSTKSRGGKIERIFIPALVDFLNRIWLDIPVPIRNGQEHAYMAFGTYRSNISLKTRYDFWRGKIKSVRIECVTENVEREPNPLDERFENVGT